MGARLTPGEAQDVARIALEQRMAAEGLTARWWSNAAGYRYDRHEHDYHKVLYCAAGSITFHTDEGDFDLAAGDRLDVPPHTSHAATVGADGVECVEAAAHR